MTSSVPGVQTVHPRESWQDPSKPITGPRLDWDDVTMNVAHYTADDNLIDGDPGEYADRLDEFMRAMQASYLRVRGYSLGYLWGVDWLGGAWEIRGWDYRSAANKGDKRKTGMINVNPKTAPILYLVDGQDRLTKEAAATGRALGAEAERRAGRKLGRPKPHSDLDYTQCCGDGIRRDISEGLLDPGVPSQPDKPTTPTTTKKDEDMIGLDFGNPPGGSAPADSWWTRLTYCGDTLTHVKSPADALQARAKITIVPINETELNALLDNIQTIGDSPFYEGGQAPNSALHTKWEQARGRT